MSGIEIAKMKKAKKGEDLSVATSVRNMLKFDISSINYKGTCYDCIYFITLFIAIGLHPTVIYACSYGW
jgi:hypothetical protein